MKHLLSLLFVVVFAATTPTTIDLDKFDNNADIYARSTDSITASTDIEIVVDEMDMPISKDKFPYELKGFKEGTYPITTPEKSYKLHIDDTAPDISATLESGTYQEADVTFTVKDFDEDISATFTKNNEPQEITFTEGSANVKLTENGLYVVRIQAHDAVGNENIKTFTYTIHKTAPEVTFTGLDKEVQSSDYSIKINIKSDIELKSQKVTLDGVEIDDISEAIAVSEEGTHTLKVEAEDIAGNKTEETKTFTIDKTAPTLNITGVQDGDLKNTDVTYSITGSDNITATLQKDNGAKQNCSLNGTISEDGKYKIEAEAVDEAGNKTTKSVSFEIDKTAPEIKINGVPDKITNSSVNYSITADGDITAVITGQKETSSGTTDVEETKTGKNSVSGSITDNGTYTITVNSTDEAGNKAEQKIVTFTIDKKAPELTIEGVEDKKFYDTKTITYNVTGTDISATTQEAQSLVPTVTIDGKTAEPSATVELAEGSHTLKAKIVDEAGNNVEKTVSFEIDTTVPALSFNDVKCVNDLKKVSANGTDKNLTSVVLTAFSEKKAETIGNSKFTVSGNSGPLSLKNDYDDESADDSWTFTVTATDKAGNVNSMSKTVTRDTIAPKINLDKVDRYINRNVNINASSEDPNPSSTKLYVDKDGKEQEMPLTTTLSNEGYYEVTVKAVDAAGNKSDKTIKFTIDKTPPKVDIDAPSGHNKSVSKVSSKMNENGTIHLDVICDKKSIFSDNAEDSISFSKLNKDGEYVVKSYATDLAGNKSKEEEAKFIIDSTAPVVKLSGIKTDSFANKAVTITAEVNERFYETNDVSFTYNGTKIPFRSTGATSKVSHTFNKDGIYEVKLFAKDKAGNTSSTQTLKFTLDTKKPEITISAPDQGTYDTLIAPKVTIKDEYFKTKDISLTNNIAFKDSFNKKGGTRSYINIPKLKENDGIYTLNVRATDEAGNISTATKTFVVNRFGSSFKVKSKPSDYGKSPDSDVVIVEKNVSGIDSYEVKVFRDAESFDAENVKVKTDGNTTTYTIPKSNFEKDGVYKVVLTTKDKAGNTSKSKNDFSFVIDNVQPVITYKGVEPNSTYQESKVKVYIQTTDTLTEKPEIKVTSGLKTLEVKEDENGQYVEIGFGYNQNIKIQASDRAGNTATTEIENVSVSTSKLAPVLAHKKLAAGIFAGVAALGAGLAVLLAKRKKKNSPEGDDIVM